MGNPTIAAWRAAGENGDAAAATACLAPEVELISPLTAQFRFHGPAQVADVLASAFAQLLRLNPDGLIREITFFGRPLPALTEVMAGIGPRLLRRQRRPGLARLVGL